MLHENFYIQAFPSIPNVSFTGSYREVFDDKVSEDDNNSDSSDVESHFGLE